jgi:hypothetical protein
LKLQRTIEKIEEWLDRFSREMTKFARNGALGEPPAAIEVERIHVDNLSVETFLREYAHKSLPIVISGLNMTKVPWTLEHIKEKCGHRHVTPVEKDENATSWGRLKPVESVNVSEFIDTYRTNSSRAGWYVHDWTLPAHCEEIIGQAPYTELKRKSDAKIVQIDRRKICFSSFKI